MKLVIISDTHDRHRQLKLPDGDVLIHGGDSTVGGYPDESKDFMDWFWGQPHPRKILIAGNHDFNMEKWPAHFKYDGLTNTRLDYLLDSGVDINDTIFWGSPWTPRFGGWAFMLDRGQPIADKWNLINPTTDVLITHGPPKGILDRVYGQYENCGCDDLLTKVLKVKPKLHIFGHIHGDAGIKELNGTTFINASIVGEDYKVRNAPIEIEI